MKLSIEVLEQFGINTLFNQSLKLNIISAIKAIEFLLFPTDDTIKDYGGITIYSFYHMQNVIFNCGQIFNLFQAVCKRAIPFFESVLPVLFRRRDNQFVKS